MDYVGDECRCAVSKGPLTLCRGRWLIGLLACEFNDNPKSKADCKAEPEPKDDTVDNIAEWNAETEPDQYAEHNTLGCDGTTHLLYGG
jgi:hypothetical protein